MLGKNGKKLRTWRDRREFYFDQSVATLERFVLLFQVKGVGKCGYYRLWKEGMEDEDEEDEKVKKEVRYREMRNQTC